MKKILAIVFIGSIISACTNPKDEEKALLNEVIKIHDKVMSGDEHLMKNKMKLDTLLLPGKLVADDDTLKEKMTIRAILYKLNVADSGMELWMKNFDPEQKGKSHAEIMAYFADQKRQVTAVDSVINDAVKISDDYIPQIKVKK